VHAGPQRDDIWRILGASAGRKHSYLAEWVATGPELEPRVRQDWGLDEIGEQLADNTGISAEAWNDLAQAFIDALGEEHIRRSGR